MKKQIVKMKVREMLKVYTGLTEVIREKKLFSGEANLAIARNNKILENEINAYSKSVEDLVGKYAHKDSNGNPETKELPSGERVYVFETNEDKTAYVEGIRNLEAADLEIDVHMIASSAFDEKYEQPTAYDLVALEFMIED